LNADPNYRPVGTYEDILSIFARSEQRRYVRAGVSPPKKNAFVRWVGEPFLNAVGIGITWYGEMVGASRMISLHDTIMGGLAGKSKGPFNPDLPEFTATRELMAHVEEIFGTAPAVLCLMSHPPVLPESLGLNVEMGRQALLALHSLRPKSGHAKLMIAVDSYALDMLAPMQEGAYAGFMGTYHLGLDRLIHHRRIPSRWLLGGAAWWRLPWRTSRFLSHGGRLAFVLSGGVPITARVVYTAREFLWRLRRGRKQGLSPQEIARRLEREESDFLRFCQSGMIGPGLRGKYWRLMEAWIVARLTGIWPPNQTESANDELSQGFLPEKHVRCFQACARAMGYPDDTTQKLVQDFQKEYARETPYRERFFRFLLHRVLSRGRPIILLPLSHQLDPSGPAHAMKLAWEDPIALLQYQGDDLKICSGPAFTQTSVPADRFARDFVSAHYT